MRQKFIYKLIFVGLFALMSTIIVSCSKDESDDIENISSSNETPGDASAKYDIVGCWVATYKWAYSGIVETITMEINRDGTLSFLDVSSNGEEPFLGSGTWVYNQSNHNWALSTSHSLVSGTYRLVNDQLVNAQSFSDGSTRTIIFNKQ